MNAVTRFEEGTTQSWVLMTAKLASQLLSNRHPRQLDRYSEKTAKDYAKQMRAGTWDDYHPQTYAVSTSGLLLDGQHRLEAMLMADTFFHVLLVRGVDPEVYGHLDAGKARSLQFRAARTRDDMAIYMAIYNVATHGRTTKMRPTIEGIDMIASFVQEEMELFKAGATQVRKLRINPAPTRAAVVLMMKLRPSFTDAICSAYNNYVTGNFKSAPESMSTLYRRMTENLNPAPLAFSLAWRAFDPMRFEVQRIQIASALEVIKEARTAVLHGLGEL